MGAGAVGGMKYAAVVGGHTSGNKVGLNMSTTSTSTPSRGSVGRRKWHGIVAAVGLAAACAVVVPACGENPGPGTTGPTAATAGGGLEKCVAVGAKVEQECYAKLDLRRALTNQQLNGAVGEKTEIQVGGVAPTGELFVDFRLRNTSSVATAAPLRIDDIWLTYAPQNPGETEDLALECFDASGQTLCAAMKGKWKKVVPPGSDLQVGSGVEEGFKIRYKQFDSKARQGRVCLRMGGTSEYAKANLCFDVVTTAGKPKIKAQPTLIDIPYVQVGKQTTRELQISNLGDATLFVSKMELNLDPTFALKIGDQSYKAGAAAVFDPPMVIGAGSSQTAELLFKPTDDKKRQGEIRIFSNDSTFVGGLPVLVNANSKVPCILIKPMPTVNFGAVELGKVATQNLNVTNCGTEKLTITSFAIKAGGSSAYALDWAAITPAEPKLTTKAGPSETAPLVLEPNGAFELPANYVPATLSVDDPSTQAKVPDVASVEVVSNASPQAIKFTGICVTKNCAEAKVSVAEGEQVVPQTVLHLKGDNSIAPGGGKIVKYLWKVTTQPEGSQQTFVPSAKDPNPTFQTNVAGEYKFCLDVWDDSIPEVKSCFPACISVIAIPSQALHVELLWKTPADPDETDKGQGVGADIDLHFAHPLAQGPDQDCDGQADPWFSTPFDAFWFNTTPKWGSSATEEDDGRLDLDDTDGAGPENLNLNAPQGTATEPQEYAVGVHYWNDFGFGPSFVTVRVYVLGKQVVELANHQLLPVDFWFVGKVNWPNKEMGGQGPVLKQCFQSGNACAAKKNPADPKGGAMWQPSGAPCITPCYLSPLANSSSAVCK